VAALRVEAIGVDVAPKSMAKRPKPEYDGPITIQNFAKRS
jgi:hypothetical protein